MPTGVWPHRFSSPEPAPARCGACGRLSYQKRPRRPAEDVAAGDAPGFSHCTFVRAGRWKPAGVWPKRPSPVQLKGHPAGRCGLGEGGVAEEAKRAESETIGGQRCQALARAGKGLGRLPAGAQHRIPQASISTLSKLRRRITNLEMPGPFTLDRGILCFEKKCSSSKDLG